jgi:hypothetical protein
MSKQRRERQRSLRQRDRVNVSGFSLQLPPEMQLQAGIQGAAFEALNHKLDALGHQLAKNKVLEHGQPTREVIPTPVVNAVAQIATNAWRAKMRMVNPDNGEPREDMSRVYRHVEAIFDTLHQLGVETTDPAGRNYHSGMALKVVTFEPTPGLSKEEIKETIRPSISWQGRLIQMGEVVVGTPVAPEKVKDNHEQNNH